MQKINRTNRALFLDRDGTLMHEVDHCHRPQDVRAYHGTADALQQAKEKNWMNIIITNQSGLGRKYFSLGEFYAVQNELINQLNGYIDDSFFSADLPDSGSFRRKPNPGMIFEAVEKHQVDISQSFMIGDKALDMECGKNAGLRTILVLTGYGKKLINHDDNKKICDYIVPTVTEAIFLALQLD